MFKSIITAITLSIVSSSAFALTLECTGELNNTWYGKDYNNYSFAFLDNDDIFKKTNEQDTLIVNITDDKISVDGIIQFTVYATGQYNTETGKPYYSMEVEDTEILAYYNKDGWNSKRNEYTGSPYSGEWGTKSWFSVNRLTGRFTSDSTYILHDDASERAILLQSEMSGTCKLAKPLF